MANSKVYFIDLKSNSRLNLLDKLKRLLLAAGIETIDFSHKITALKLHFGEAGNMAYIRPDYLAVIADLVKAQGGLPFLTDANTLYKGSRSNGVDHLTIASQHGFNPLTTGCNVVIADGIKGTDFKEITINQKHCRTAKIASAVAQADVLISVSHFKGHEMSGFGGCLKNIGMGSGSVGGKLEMHSDSQPVIYRDNCIGCNVCVRNCAQETIALDAERKAVIDYVKCVGCGQCVAVCQYDAAQVQWNAEKMQEKMMEYALAVLREKPAFHINFLMNISPDCDCWNYNDSPIVPDIGIMASFDPVAIDRASVDMVNHSPILPNSRIGEHVGVLSDRFDLVAPKTNWRIGLDYAESLGLGQQAYELVRIG
jgi:uncharacterized protein